MNRIAVGVTGLTVVGGALIGLALYYLTTGRPRGPAVEAALAGLGLMLVGAGLLLGGPLGLRVMVGGAVVGASASMLSLRRHDAELRARDQRPLPRQRGPDQA